MDASVPQDIDWLAPWQAVEDGSGLEAELRREVVHGHPLCGLTIVAVGRRVDCDDVLFRVDHPSCALAVVHLTWRMKSESDPKWPHTTLFTDWDDWVGRCMKPDNEKNEGHGE